MNILRRLIITTLLCLFAYNSVAVAGASNDKALWNKLSAQSQNGWRNASKISSQDMARLETLAKKGDANARYSLGMIKLANHQQNAALNWLDQAQADGHMPARLMYQQALTQQNSGKYSQ